MHCPFCEKGLKFQPFYKIEEVFENSDLFDFVGFTQNSKATQTRERAARGACTIELVQCENCGYIFNKAFNLDKALAAYADERYYQQKNFRLGKNILNIANEILAFLPENACILKIVPSGHYYDNLTSALAKHTNFIYSVDPNQTAAAIKGLANVEHVQAFFDYESMKNKITRKLDMIVVRHRLEYMNEPRKLLCDLIKMLENGALLYIEVPNIDEFIDKARFYEIYHDHCGYYQASTICKVLQELGCELIKRVTFYNEQHQGFFFQKSKKPQIYAHKPRLYGDKARVGFEKAIKKLDEIIANYKSVGIYGAGNRANAFINAIKSVAKIKKAFDANVDKQGRFLHNSDIKIYAPSPENLADIECIIMVMPVSESVVYKYEIRRFISEGKWRGVVVRTLDCREILVEDFRNFSW